MRYAKTCRFQMCSIVFVRATNFNVLISPTLCEQYIWDWTSVFCLAQQFITFKADSKLEVPKYSVLSTYKSVNRTVIEKNWTLFWSLDKKTTLQHYAS